MLKIFMNEPFATGHELAQASLKESLAALAASKIRRVGPTKGGRWEVVE